MGIRTLIVILSLCSVSLLSAQKKVIYEGEACYLYIVEKGNTLYGISKEYAAPIPSIVKINPTVKSGLSIGQKIYIPLHAISKREAKRSPEMEGNVLVHKVAKGETLYSLSKKYQIDQGVLLEANPGLSEIGLKKSQEIRIPTISVMVEQSLVRPAVDDTLVHHEVIQGETLYSLSKNYEVEITDIKKINGGLPDGLRTGMTLRLPIRRSGAPMNSDSRPQDVVETEVERHDISDGVTFDIGLLLPFALGTQDTSGTVIPRKRDDIMKLTDIAFEFYRGSQMALEELTESGLSASVHVIDVSSSAKDVDRCLKRKGISDLDLVIGPLHKEAFEMVSSNGKLAKVFRASPISSTLGTAASNDPNAARVKSSDEELIQNVIDDIRRNHAEKNIVLLSGEKRSFHKEFMQKWNLQDTTDTGVLEISIKQLAWDKDAQTKLAEILDETGSNVIIFPVADRPSITDLMANLATTAFRDIDITLFGMEQWMKYDNLDAAVLERVNLHIPVSSFVDLEDRRTIEFIREYKDVYGTIPSAAAYAMLSYDITMFYVRGMMYYGDSFLEHQDQLQSTGIITGFEMRRSPQGAWVNDYGLMLEYQDHDFVRAN
jgi:LysM repeat protein